MADHTKNDGGPAYPQSETLYEDGAELARTAHGGMTLRDWFAGQALAGLLAGRGGPLQRKFMSAEAQWAYDYAAAMLAAREASTND